MHQVYVVPYSLSLLPTQLSSLIVPHLPPTVFFYPMAEVAFSVFPRSEQLSWPFRCHSPLLPTGLSCFLLLVPSPKAVVRWFRLVVHMPWLAVH